MSDSNQANKRGFILGATLGDCVHVAGILNFLRLAETQGYSTHFLGAAARIEELVEAAVESNPDMIAVSFRLSPDVARPLMEELKEELKRHDLLDKRLVFGGTAPVCEVARDVGMFEAVFDGSSAMDDVLTFLGRETKDALDVMPPQSLVERIQSRSPHPIIRHHYGQPKLESTLEGIQVIAESKVLDVISIGPDQNAQVAFFRPEEQDPRQDGAGGVPVRSLEDFQRLYEASRVGNYPLMRCYSGTRDTLKLATILVDGIHNAWCAVPLFWYNELDGRGPRSLPESIDESQSLMRWHGERDIPVEVNEAHHWSLRDAPDVIAVVAAYLAAHNAKACGVKDYVAQYMFNTPPATSVQMDLAKMLAKKALIEELQDEEFRVWRQVRAGLLSFPADLDLAKGQLAASTVVQMALDPHIVHVVSFTEANHAATAEDVIASCKIVRQVIHATLFGMPDLTADSVVRERRDQLLAEAKILLDAIAALDSASEDPLSEPDVLVRAVELGYLDAPHLAGNLRARGTIQTRMVDGACWAVDPVRGEPLSESERLARIKDEFVSQ